MERYISSPPVVLRKDDAFDSMVEELVNTPKVAVETDTRKTSQRIPNKFVFKIKAHLEHSKHFKVTATKAGGQWYISLVTESVDILRQYHFQYNGHTNPDGTTIGRSHKHFPTRQHPLREGHKDIETWAYDPGPYPQDFEGSVKEFCSECNITIEALQERVNWL